MIKSKVITVSTLGQEYPVVIKNGFIDAVPAWVYRQLRPSKVMILTNNRIEKIYGKPLLDSFRKRHASTSLFSIKDGEIYKTHDSLLAALNHLRKNEFQRDSCLVALGGELLAIWQD